VATGPHPLDFPSRIDKFLLIFYMMHAIERIRIEMPRKYRKQRLRPETAEEDTEQAEDQHRAAELGADVILTTLVVNKFKVTDKLTNDYQVQYEFRTTIKLPKVAYLAN